MVGFAVGACVVGASLGACVVGTSLGAGVTGVVGRSVVVQGRRVAPTDDMIRSVMLTNLVI